MPIGAKAEATPGTSHSSQTHSQSLDGTYSQVYPEASTHYGSLDSGRLTPAGILQLQRLVGNQAVVRMLKSNTPHLPRKATGSVPSIQRDDYKTASPDVLKMMDSMGDELAQLRAAAPPSKGPRQEAGRTFCVVKVVDDSGKVVQSATGEYLGRGKHAEEVALGKIDARAVRSTDRVLVMVDQYPCEDKCTPALQKFREKVKGEFRVFHRVSSKDGRVIRSPKTEATNPSKASHLFELEEFHRSPKATPGGTSGSVPGNKGTPSPSAHSTGTATNVAKPTPSSPTAKPGVSVSPEVRAIARESAKSLKSELRYMRASRLLSGGLAIFQAYGNIQMYFAVMNMTSNKLLGKGFILTKLIEQANLVESEMRQLKTEYTKSSESLWESQYKLDEVAYDPKSASQAYWELNALHKPLGHLKYELEQRLKPLRQMRDEAVAKENYANALLNNRESLFALVLADWGSTALAAEVFALSQDWQDIRSALGSAVTDLEETIALIEGDLGFLSDWDHILFESSEQSGLFGLPAGSGDD